MEEHATMFYASIVLKEMLDCFLLFHDIMADPKVKQHSEVIFLSETLLSQYKSVCPLTLKS
jgi:hypothetical protein